MKKKKIAVLSIIIIVIAAIVIYAVCKKDVDDYHEKYEGYDLTSDVEGVSRENTYTEYLSQHESDALATQDIDLDVCDYTQGEDVKIMTDYEGEKEVLYTGDDSSVTWEVNVEKAGLYNVFLEYLTVESRGVNIERVLEINPEHSVFKSISQAFADGNKDKVAKYTNLLYSQALLIEGLSVENPVEFSNLICELMN